MIEGSCHCGAVRFAVPHAPEQVTLCNCSICAKNGSLTAYYPPAEVRFLQGREAMSAYSWGDKLLAFRFCATCGCRICWEALPERMAEAFPDDTPPRMGVNARLLEGVELEKVPVRVFDGAAM